MRSDRGFTRLSVLDIYENPNIRSFASILEAQSQKEHASTEFKPVSNRRYALAKIWQALGLLFIFGIQGMFWLGPIIAAIVLSNDWGYNDFHALLIAIALHALSVPVLVLLAVAMKWIVAGRLRPGSYPLWG